MSEKSHQSRAEAGLDVDAERVSGPGDVGDSVEKVDGRGLVTGKAKYTDDVATDDALAGKMLYSPHAHAIIMSLDTSAAEELEGVRAVVTRTEDFPNRYSRQGVPHPQPAPYDEGGNDPKVRFVGDPVAAVAADSEAVAAAAIEAIEVEYEVLAHVLRPDEAMAKGAPILHDEDEYENAQPGSDRYRNVVADVESSEGDVDAAFAEADHVVEGAYSTQSVQHAQLEPNATIAWVDDRERLVLRTSTQTAHLVRENVARAFGLPRSKVKVVKPRVGGGFGGKQDTLPTQYYAAALAMKADAKVRLVTSRADDLFATHCRHAMEMTVRTGVTDDGEMTAMEIDITSNTGAYGNHGLTVLSNGGHETLSLYSLKNRRFTGRAVYTNITPAAAMRGYGSPQAAFAVESHVDEVAREIGMSPRELRERNIVYDGEKAFDPGFSESKRPFTAIALDECIEKATVDAEWQDNPRSVDEDDRYVRGFGMGLAMHKSGVAGDEFAGAEITVEDDGTATLRVGVGDIGQGADTAMAQIASGVLGIPTSDIHVQADDTDATPWDNGAYGSSTTYVSGLAVRRAAEEAAEKLCDAAADYLDGDPSSITLSEGVVESDTGDSITVPELAAQVFTGVDGPKKRIVGHGDAAPDVSPKPFAAQVAEVEVDTETGQFEVLQLVNAADVGYAIHPENCRGQIIGAAIMGYGQAVSEEMRWDEDGTPEITALREYKSPRAGDVPARTTGILVEPYEPSGPFGAKSVGETCNIAPAAAIANAIRNACDARITDLPITAEKVAVELESTDRD